MLSFNTEAERNSYNSEINKKTLEIAQATNHKRIILYLWVALNVHISNGNHRPTLNQLAKELRTNADHVREAVLYLQDNGYIKVTTDIQRRRQYDITW
jgi:Mn-dependent DtxR family transcriptional regulator